MPKKFFASLDENGVVNNHTSIDYLQSLIEFSEDQSITNNLPSIGYTYDEDLNAFIPPKPDETYILNLETYQWEPDPNREYVIDGATCRWSPKLKTWILLENWSDEEHL